MGYYATTSGRETLRDFFSPSTSPVIKRSLVTSTPTLHTPWLDGKGIPAFFLDTQPGTGHLSYPLLPPPSLFANDTEIGNHFVFSVIMNIWRAPSGRVVI